MEIRFAIGEQVVIYNREKQCREVGRIVNSYIRNKVRRYDVKLERSALPMEFVSTNKDAKYFIDQELTIKMFRNAEA